MGKNEANAERVKLFRQKGKSVVEPFVRLVTIETPPRGEYCWLDELVALPADAQTRLYNFDLDRVSGDLWWSCWNEASDKLTIDYWPNPESSEPDFAAHEKTKPDLALG